jgi:hypothetical protein
MPDRNNLIGETGRTVSAWKRKGWGGRGGRGEKWPKRCMHIWINEFLKKSNLKEERFILAYGFRRFGPWLLDPMSMGRTSWQWECGVEICLLHGWQEVERWKGTMDPIQPSPGRPHFPKFPEPPKISPSTGSQVFKTWAVGTFYIQTVTVLFYIH